MQIIRKTALDDGLAAFHPETPGRSASTPPRSTSDAPTTRPPVPDGAERRHASSDSPQVSGGELEALTAAVESLTLWTIGLTMLVGALVVLTILRLG